MYFTRPPRTALIKAVVLFSLHAWTFAPHSSARNLTTLMCKEHQSLTEELEGNVGHEDHLACPPDCWLIRRPWALFIEIRSLRVVLGDANPALIHHAQIEGRSGMSRSMGLLIEIRSLGGMDTPSLGCSLAAPKVLQHFVTGDLSSHMRTTPRWRFAHTYNHIDHPLQ